MGLIKLKVKKQIFTEEQMEAFEGKDLGNFTPKGSSYIYVEAGFRSEEIKEIYAHSPVKTMIVFYEGSPVMAAETFQTVFEKWEIATKTEEPPIPTDFEAEEEQESEEDED